MSYQILLSWFSSYLTNRSLQVKIHGFLSNPFLVTSGAPQGEHLSPLLFTIFIMGITSCFKFCDHQLFANDLKLYTTENSPGDSIKIQNNLNSLSDWCITNELKLNTLKCVKMSFYYSQLKFYYEYFILGIKLKEVNFVTNLGVIIQQNLMFSSCVEKTCSKALKNLGFLIRNTKEFNNEVYIKTLYVSNVRPILEYS